MRIYNVMLEGKESGLGFLKTFEVSAYTGEQATNLALAEAKRLELDIVGVGEITLKRTTYSGSEVRVLKTFGTGYFDL